MRHSQDSHPMWQAKVQEAKWLNDKSPRWDIIISIIIVSKAETALKRVI